MKRVRILEFAGYVGIRTLERDFGNGFCHVVRWGGRVVRLVDEE
jgi:hypothetical protein